MGSLLATVGALLIVLSGLALMLGWKPAASWLFRAALVLILGTAMVQYLACCLRVSAQRASLTGGELVALFGISGFALYGWLVWRKLHSPHGARSALRPQARGRVAPPPPLPEDAS